MSKECHPQVHNEQRRHIVKAVWINTVIAGVSVITGTAGSSSGVLGEALHDGADAFSHSLDLLGHRSPNDRLARIFRRLSAVTISGTAAWFAYRSGVELTQPQEAMAWYTGPVAVGAAVANRYVSRQFDHDHDHSDQNYAGASTHARVDSIMSPLLAAGVVTAQLARIPVADELAGLFAGVGTVAGNWSATKEAFKPHGTQPAHTHTHEAHPVDHNHD